MAMKRSLIWLVLMVWGPNLMRSVVIERCLRMVQLAIIEDSLDLMSPAMMIMMCDLMSLICLRLVDLEV